MGVGQLSWGSRLARTRSQTRWAFLGSMDGIKIFLSWYFTPFYALGVTPVSLH